MLRGGGFGVYVYKNEDHSLKMHFKSFQAILDNVVFYPFTSPLSCQRGGVSSLEKNEPWSKNAFYVILSHFSKCCYLPGGGCGQFDYSIYCLSSSSLSNSEQSESRQTKFPPLKSLLVVVVVGWPV